MRILLVHRYFWPDVAPYAQMLRIMARRYAEEGHDVAVFTSQPSYNDVRDGHREPRLQELDGFRVYRMPLLPESKTRPIRRAINSLCFAIGLVWYCLRRPAYDVMTVSTVPPVIMGAAARMVAALRRTSYVYHCQDIHPEAATVSGVLTHRWLLRFMSWIDHRNCQKSAATVVLSEDMRASLLQRGLPTGNILIINNFIMDDGVQPEAVPSMLEKPAGTFRVLFAGNIGRYQGLEAVIDAAKTLAEHPKLHFVFVGAGAAAEALKERAGALLGSTVFFYPFQQLPVVLEMMRNADLALVSLQANMFRYAYPSKTMMYMEAGCRILAVIEPESELARLVLAAGIGSTCPSDSALIAQCVRYEYGREPLTVHEREAIRRCGEAMFGQATILGKWSELMRTLEAGRS